MSYARRAPPDGGGQDKQCGERQDTPRSGGQQVERMPESNHFITSRIQTL